MSSLLPRISPRLWTLRLFAPFQLCLLLLFPSWLWGAYTDPTVTLKITAPGGTAHQPILVLPESGPAQATLVASAFNFAPTSYTWSQIPAGQNSYAATNPASIATPVTTLPQVGVTFPAYGVYQLQVTATDGTLTASRYLWVQVWDNVSGLNPLHRVGRNPDVAPPTSVRQLSPDPGPYCHPRLFFSRSDWGEQSGKATTSTEVSSAITRLQNALNNNFDKTGGTMKTYATVLQAYAASGYDPAYYTSNVVPAYAAAGTTIAGGLIGANPGSNFFDALTTAAYLAWIGTNPMLDRASVSPAAQARFTYLATLTATAAKVELAVNGNSKPFYDVALCYDLLYDWMTATQQADTRDYLYAIGYGYYNTGGGGLAKTAPNPMPSGREQNGDFPNLADDVILPALVIEGEEGSVSAGVQSTYGPTASYATGPNAWPYASPASVSNLYRQSLWNTDWFLTPWGSMLHHSAYFELSMTHAMPSTLALARRGQNLFVTTNLYQANLHIFQQLARRQSDGKMVIYDHHEGGMGNGSSTNNARFILKYMFPDDPMIDYVHRAYRAEGSGALIQAIFGLDTTTQPLSQVAQAKQLALTKLDPMRGVSMTRSAWGEDELSVYFECRADVEGHMHAEANNFSLYALGRAWSVPPGYHCTINDCASTVLIQQSTIIDPVTQQSVSLSPVTQGYIGQSPSSETQSTTAGHFPTPPGKLLEVVEDPGSQWSLSAGDATAAYRYGYNGSAPTSINTGQKLSSFFYDGVLPFLRPAYQTALASSDLVVQQNYNPVDYALRSVLTVRGERPYVLVIDDITVDGVTPRNFRWNMPCAISFGGSGGRFVDANNSSVYSSLAMQSGATATEAVLYHSPIDDQRVAGQAGLPRLLVRDVTEQSTTGQPAIALDSRPSGYSGGNLAYGYDNNSKQFTTIPTKRLLIERQNVVSPKYKVLLFPYRTGEATPLTSWDATKSILTVDLRNGFTDSITLDSTQADHRTRITALARTKAGRTAPTLNMPTDLIISANSNLTASNGQPGGAATYTITASDDLGTTLTPAVSSPSGTVFPVGVNTVTVTATDSAGQIRTGQFKVTVIPAAPSVTVTSIANLPGGTYGITLNWPVFYGATAYSVKRSTTPGGPYTTIADRQKATSYTDSGLAGTGHYYVVTAWLDTYEGPASVELPLVAATGAFTGRTLGTAGQGNGVYQQGGRYLLTCSQGDIGAFSEQCTFLAKPWSGDGSFTARLTSTTAQGGSLSQFSKFGVMMRSSTTANAQMAMSQYNTYVSPFAFLQRATNGALGTGPGPFTRISIPVPVWLRLVRSGNTLSAFYSYDGSNWLATAAAATIAFPTSTLVGLAIAPQNTVTTNGAFDNVVFLGTPTFSATSTAITLDWAGSEAASYSVQRSASSSGPWINIGTALTDTRFTDTNVSAGSAYYYTITASGPDGGATTSPAIRGVATQITLGLPAEISLTTSDPSGAVATFSPTASDTIDGALAPVISPVSGTKFPVGTTTVTVSASNSSGITATGTFRVVVTLLPPEIPVGLSVTPGFTINSLTWSAATGAASYTIRRATSAEGPYSVIASGLTTTSYTDSALVTGTTYYYVVTAVNNTAESSASTQAAGAPVPGAATKANNTTALDLGTSWSTGTVPTPQDTALWTGTYGNGTASIGSGLNVLGLQLTSPSQAITVAASTGSLRLGSSGVDLTAATQNLTLNAPVVLNSSQTWTVNTNRTVAAADVSAAVGLTLTKAGAGTLTFTGPVNLPGGVVANAGTLTFGGGTSQSVSSISGTATVTYTNTATSGSTLNFASGTTLARFLPGGGSVTLTNSGPTTFAIYGYNSAATWVTTFSGGTWTLGSTGANTGQNYGTTIVTNGAVVNVTSARFGGHGTWTVGGPSGPGTLNNAGMTMESAPTSAFTLQIKDRGVYTGGATTLSLSQALTTAQANSFTIEPGGSMTLTGNLQLGGTVAMGAGGSESNTVNLTGGKLSVAGTLSASASLAGTTKTFSWTAGQLTAATITPSAGFAAPASGGGLSSTDLIQTGGTFAPGDAGTAGRTVLNGNYNQAGGILAIDLGGTTQATAFQTGQYDYVNVTGSATLGGTLAVALVNNYNPAAATTFTILNAPTGIAGAFANVAFGNRIVTAGGEGSLVVSKVGNTITLGSYLAQLPPTGTVASGGAAQIGVNWVAPTNAPGGTTYTVLRAPSGGTFTSIASGLTTTSYVDRDGGAGLPEGTGYTYAVLANYGGISTPPSNFAGATTYTGLQNWRLAQFGTLLETGSAADLADPDGDGLCNLAEYALNGNPSQNTPGVAPALGSSAGRLTLSFMRMRSDVNYVVEGTSDFQTWQPIATNPGAIGQRVTVSDSVDISAAPMRILRLRLVRP